VTEPATLSRDEQMLAEIAERDFALACRVHDQAMAAEPAETPELVRAYQKATRSLRQTLALKARLSGLMAERAQKAAERAERERAARIDRKKAQIKGPLERAVWDECERIMDVEPMLDRLDDLLSEAALADDFLDQPLELILARLRRHLDLPEPAHPAPEPTGAILRADFNPDSS
jgi:hypothetical protein